MASANNSAFDQRLVQVDIELPGGPLSFGADAAIYASGVKFGNANQNQCECRIFNLTKEQRNYLLTHATPLTQPGVNRTPVSLNLRVGRQSYGTFLLFTGQMIACNITQPPDIGVTLRALTNNLFNGVILGASQPAVSSLKTIAQSIANSFSPPLTLDFSKATDRAINNFALNGSANNGIVKLNQMGGIDAYIDNNTLIVIDSDKARNDAPILISEETGMIGIPQVTERGVNVTVMMNNQLELGSSIKVDSIINPAANGVYKVYKLNFEVASRDQPFWYVVESSLPVYYQGTAG